MTGAPDLFAADAPLAVPSVSGLGAVAHPPPPPGSPVVTLADGRKVSSWSPEWRAECLERHAHAVRLLGLRREFRAPALAAVAEDRGAVYAARLREAILSLRAARKAAAAETADD